MKARLGRIPQRKLLSCMLTSVFLKLNSLHIVHALLRQSICTSKRLKLRRSVQNKLLRTWLSLLGEHVCNCDHTTKLSWTGRSLPPSKCPTRTPGIILPGILNFKDYLQINHSILMSLLGSIGQVYPHQCNKKLPTTRLLGAIQ